MKEETSERFEKLEAHIAHLEHQVEQLNEVHHRARQTGGSPEEGSAAPIHRHANAGVGTHQGEQSQTAASLGVAPARLTKGFASGTLRP
jgi:hypothetical protein